MDVKILSQCLCVCQWHGALPLEPRSSTLNTRADRMSTAIYEARRRGGVKRQPRESDWLQLHCDVKCHSMRLGSGEQTRRRRGRRGGVNHSGTVH